SDPGFKLIRQVVQSNVAIEVLPGASSILVALVGSGLPTDKFYFGGFLPKNSGKRQTTFNELKNLPATLIFFESPYRLHSALIDAKEVFGNRNGVIARELTKLHQEFWRGTIDEAVETFYNKKIKGEIVLLFEKNSL